MRTPVAPGSRGFCVYGRQVLLNANDGGGQIVLVLSEAVLVLVIVIDPTAIWSITSTGLRPDHEHERGKRRKRHWVTIGTRGKNRFQGSPGQVIEMRLEIQRICVPTDFSAAADHAVHYAAALAHTYGADLHLLHVIEHAGPLVHHPDFTGDGEVARAYFNQLEQAVTQAEQELEEGGDQSPHEVSDLIRSLESGALQQFESVSQQWWSGLDVHRDIRYGHAVKEILHYVELRNIDLVVMGTHGHSKLASVLLGSVTERIVRTCSCPVTVIRHPEHQYNLASSE